MPLQSPADTPGVRNRFAYVPVMILLLSLLPAAASSQSRKPIARRFALSFDVGNWQPHSLNDEPRFDTFGAAGATPSFRLGITLPIGLGSGIELGARYWALRDLEQTERVHSLTLIPLSLNLKHWLIPNYFISAYVIYGGSIYQGTENETQPLKLSTTSRGWGINLGAGVDIQLSERIGAGVTFTYYYARFDEPIGGVDDFSGPCISGRFYLLL
ncbi:outer membrane beta-barrel protein [bacterium]|nr:outer membrane beta-barrel protein [bacterium]